MQELMTKIQELKNNLQNTGEILGLAQKKERILELEDKMQESDFWANQKKAKQVSQELADLKDEVSEFENLEKEINDLLAVAQESAQSGDTSLEKDIGNKLRKLQKRFAKLEFKTMLAKEYDQNNAILTIHAGTGGVDAQDWAEMLERMYLRYCEGKPVRRPLRREASEASSPDEYRDEGGKFKVNILDRQIGGEAGIKSVIFEVIGKYAYGYLKSEAGVHRLVRISPFDAEKMRHTSFALVEVLPELEEAAEIELEDDDLEIDTFRSSGPGGQSVNKTSSAVRIKHKPTGITVTCQNERSQLQNKQTALKILKSRLKQYNEAEQEEERKKIRGEFSEAAWGNQIRSYVLHPYKLVKDHRTGYETQDVEGVLDGELDELVESYLKWKLKR